MKRKKTFGYRRRGYNMKGEKKENTENFNQKKFNHEEFGKQLRAIRKKLKVTSDKLGFACGVNPVFIRQIEAGARVPSLPVFVKICDSLQISPANLLGNEIQIPVTDKGWNEIAKEVSQLSAFSRTMVKEVLNSLIGNLAEEEKNWDKNEENGEMDRKEFGRRLKKARKEMQYTSQEVADHCGVTSVFIRQVELGERLPSLSVFIYLCRTLQVSPAYLLGNEIKVEVEELCFDEESEWHWDELVRIQCDMTSKSQQMVKDILASLIHNLPKEVLSEKEE